MIKKKIAVVVPVFNEEIRMGAVLSDLKKLKLPVYVVDDGSGDDSYGLAQKYKVNVLRHKTNEGKGAAMRTGANKAFADGAKAVIFMDGDGQHKASDLHYFIDALNVGGYEVVFGSRNLSLGVPFFRYLGNKLASVLINMMFGIYVSDLICGYRAMTNRAYDNIRWRSDRYGVETEMVVLTGKNGLRYCEVPVEVVYFDVFKGVTWVDSVKILGDVLKWKFGKV